MPEHTPDILNAYASYHAEAVDHGTIDRENTLCGRKVKAVSQRGAEFSPNGVMACHRCARIVKGPDIA